MKPQGCAWTPEQKESFRMHYCGTCKTLGRLYGQRSRILLNFDTVFLGELLTALQGNHDQTWLPAFESYNCFRLPGIESELPVALQFAATANVIFAELALTDKLHDQGSLPLKVATRVFSRPFQQATAKLQDWGGEPTQLWQAVQRQQAREANLIARPAPDLLAWLAEPTAHMTGLMFQWGGDACQLDIPAVKLYQIGQQFGAMMYVLDALEDYTKDHRKQQFNAFRAAYGWQGDRLSDTQRHRAVEHIESYAKTIIAHAEHLPLSPQQYASFHQRLQHNLSQRLGTPTPQFIKTPALPHGGIAAATVPRFFRQIEAGANTALAYLFPTNARRFAMSYVFLLTILMGSSLSAASRSPENALSTAIWVNGLFALSLLGTTAGISYALRKGQKPGKKKKKKGTGADKKPKSKFWKIMGIVCLSITGVILLGVVINAISVANSTSSNCGEALGDSCSDACSGGGGGGGGGCGCSGCSCDPDCNCS